MNKIAIHIDCLRRGGAERVTVNLAKYLTEQGVTCYIVTEHSADYEYDVPENVTRINLGVNGNKYINYLSNISKLRKIYKNLNIDTLLIMDVPACLLAIPAVRGLGIKTFVSERNDPMHFPGKKSVIQISRKLMARADGFVFQTQEAADFYAHLPSDKCAVIPNPIYASDLPLVWKGRRRQDIVTAGRLVPQKNQKLLIEAFGRIANDYPDWDLLVYGEGELRESLQRQISAMGLNDRVSLPGNSRCLLDEIKDMSIFVLSSDFEGMPNALMEAMALGLACVSTDCPIGGPRALISPGKNGILTQVDDVDGLELALRELIRNDVLRFNLGAEAVAIRKRLDSSRVCREWHTFLASA